ncbi:MAG: HAMP domain-containing sensor histidine kinase [Eubacteriales bacterium]|nr:HAMP domain-containing sensor histidine kinase [Eubacteriales bacterium]
MERLQAMIDQAAKGTPQLDEISESRFSALENSLKKFCNESLLTGQNQEAQKNTVQELISDIAHQTLTPIANMKLYTELLREDLDTHHDELRTIQEQTEKLDFLIQSLVKLSRMENGIIAVHPRPETVSALFETLRQQYTPKAAEKRITLTIAPTQATALFDPKWTAEALGNIVDNAIKYTPAGGQITLRAVPYSFFLRIDAEDNGIGIAPEELNNIFARFYRSFEVAEQPGVGIGLYLSREIIQAQKGYIKVSSQKGRGSTFSIFLPMP